MTAAHDLAINVAAYPITFVLGGIVTAAYRWLRLWGDRRLWKPFLGRGALAVILTDKPGPRTAKVSVSEVQAFSDLRGALKVLGREVDLQIGSLANFQNLRSRPFICLGGPLANPTAKQVLNSISGLPLAFDEINKSFIIANEPPYKEMVDPVSGATTVDYGLIVRLTKLNTNATDSCPVMIIFGLRGAGTQEAVRALLYHHPLRSSMARNLKNDYYALLKFENFNSIDPCRMINYGSFTRT